MSTRYNSFGPQPRPAEIEAKLEQANLTHPIADFVNLANGSPKVFINYVDLAEEYYNLTGAIIKELGMEVGTWYIDKILQPAFTRLCELFEDTES